MQVTDVRVRRIEKEGKMKAIVSITMDNEFVIHDIKVIEGEKGLFIAMPSRKAADGEYRDIAGSTARRYRNSPKPPKCPETPSSRCACSSRREAMPNS